MLARLALRAKDLVLAQMRVLDGDGSGASENEFDNDGNSDAPDSPGPGDTEGSVELRTQGEPGRRRTREARKDSDSASRGYGDARTGSVDGSGGLAGGGGLGAASSGVTASDTTNASDPPAAGAGAALATAAARVRGGGGGSGRARRRRRRPRPRSTAAVTDRYELLREIGSGYSSVVRVARDRDTDVLRAIKVIDKAKFGDLRMLRNEVELMMQLRHANLVELVETFEDASRLYLVMEYAPGGELFDRIVDRGWFGEDEARAVFRGMCEGVAFLHSRGVMHRDLKPENVLFSEDSVVKIADFGFSALVDEEDLSLECGTVEYVAPEVLSRQGCTLASDMWSLGVILYILLCGFHPFHEETRAEMMRRIVRARVDFPSPEWDDVSPEARRLIRSLLAMSASQRPTAQACLSDPWLQMGETAAPREGDGGNHSAAGAGAGAADPAAASPGHDDKVASNLRGLVRERRRRERRRRNLADMASVARGIFGDGEAAAQFLRATNYNADIDRTIGAALYGPGSAAAGEKMPAALSSSSSSSSSSSTSSSSSSSSSSKGEIQKSDGTSAVGPGEAPSGEDQILADPVDPEAEYTRACDEFLSNLQALSEAELMEKVASKLFPDDADTRQGFLGCNTEE